MTKSATIGDTLRKYADDCDEARRWGGPTIYPQNPVNERFAREVAAEFDRLTAELETAKRERDEARAIKEQWRTLCHRHEQTILDERTRAEAAEAVAEEPVAVCRVMTMQLSSGQTDYYVSIERNGRQITPHMYKIRGRAEYDVAMWNWLLNGAEEPDILAFDTDSPATIKEE